MPKKIKRNLRQFSHDFLFCFKTALADTIEHDGVEHAGYLSFLAILSLFPFLVFFVAVAGIFGGSPLGKELMDILISNLPEGMSEALMPRIEEITSGPPQGLLTIAVFGAIWTASSSVEGLRTILNRAYRVSTPPAYIFRRLLSIAQFLIITIIIISAMFVLVLTPLVWSLVLDFFQLKQLSFDPNIMNIRFLFSSVMIFCAVSFLYYVIPNLQQKWRNVFPGAIVVVVLWSVSATLFSLYLHNFDQVNVIYGSLAGFIVALLFFYITAMILIFGAEFNYAIEKLIGFKFKEKQKVLKTKRSA